FSKRYEITGRAAPEGADLQNAPCVIGWVSGSVQPAANAHFRLTSKKKMNIRKHGFSTSLSSARPGSDDSTGPPALRCLWTTVTDSELRLHRV
ncbi:MAG: hypothetical protein SOV30_02630, partial [Dialister sp.]|nr:hypothetical protein [Dialister sp.]